MYVEWQEFIHVQFVATITQGKTREKREKKKTRCATQIVPSRNFFAYLPPAAHMFFLKKTLNLGDCVN